MTNRKSRPKVRFLPDTPAPKDFFDTHSRIADAIAESLATNSHLRTIGLLGRWGSGKSTVIHQLETAVTRYEELSSVRVFTYDAWVHQGAPVRRSFLEVLIDYLYAETLTVPDKWSKELQILSGSLKETDHIESPRPSTNTRIALLSLLPLPVGLSLLDLEIFDKGFGQETTAVGEFVFGIMFYSLAIPAFVFLFMFIGSRRKQKSEPTAEKEDVLSIVLNRTITNKRTTTLSSPEPTAIEFSRTFAKIAQDLEKRGTRLICVVDNLDRLPAGQAVEIWAAIRSLFIDDEDVSKNDIHNHPIVIVPMDRQALVSLFQSESPQDTERAESFIEKTFDLTFRVPPQVRSDWKEFLCLQMEYAFGRRVVTERTVYFVERVFDSKYNTVELHPTPRIINRFVNALGTLWLSRHGEGFRLPIVGLFVAHFDQGNQDILQFTQREDFGYFDVDFPDWRDQVAALYFGVPKSKSRQVLLEGPLKEALNTGSSIAFKNLMKYPGSFKVFDDVLRNWDYDRTKSESLDFFFGAAALLSLLNQNLEPVRRTWAFLAAKLLEIEALPSLAVLQNSVDLFHNHLSGDILRRFLAQEVDWLAGIASTSDDSDSFDLIEKRYDQISQLGILKKVPKLSLRGEPIAVLRALYWMNRNGSLKKFVTVAAPFSKLTDELTRLVEDDDEAGIVPEVIDFRYRFASAFPKEDTLPLPAIRQKALAVLEQDSSSLTSHAALTLGVMAHITTKSAEELDSSIDAGNFQSRATEALEAGDLHTAGTLFGIAIARRKTIELTHQSVADSGEKNDFLEQAMSMVDKISEKPIKSIWLAAESGNSGELMKELISFTVREREFTAKELDEIADDPEFYLSSLDDGLRYNLSKRIGLDERRVQKIGKLQPSSFLTDILGALVRSGARNAREQAKATVESLPAATWLAYLSGTEDWVIGLLDKCPRGYRLSASSNAAAAAVQFLDSKAANLSIAERSRFKKLQKWLNRFAEARVFDAFVVHGISHPRNAIGLYKQANQEFDEHLARHLDTGRFMSLLDGLSLHAPGRSWTEDHLKAFQGALDRYRPKEKASIADWIKERKAAASRVRGNWLELIWNRLSVK